MPIPDTVTQEDLARWEKEYQNSAEKNDKEADRLMNTCKKVMPIFPMVDEREVYYSGCWLGGELHDLGASEEEVSEIGQTHGQRCFFAKVMKTDCWDLAKLSIKEFESGDWTKPGEKLAAELCEQYLIPYLAGLRSRN